MANVTVVIPTFNPGPYLEPALESIARQTYADWEIVVVDDGSREDISWVENVPGVRVLRQDHAGVSAARNRGILAATGPFVALMDQDDLWHPDKLRLQVKALEDIPDAALCHCDLAVFREEQPQVRAVASGSQAFVGLDPQTARLAGRSAMAQAVEYFGTRFVVPSTVVFRRDRLLEAGLLDTLLPFSGDYDLLIRIGARFPVLHQPVELVYYRKHDRNFSDRYEVGRLEMRAMVARYVAYGCSQGDTELMKRAPALLGRPRRLFASQAYDRARIALRSGDRSAAARHLANAARLDPRTVFRGLTSYARARAKTL